MTSQWDFVIAAYAVTAIGTAAVLLHSWMRMRRAEASADTLRVRREAPSAAPQTESVSQAESAE